MWFFNKLLQNMWFCTVAPVMELAYMPVLEAGFWEFDSPLGYQILNREAAGVADRLSICGDGIDTHTVLQTYE